MKYDFDCKRISLPDLEKDQPIFKIKDRRSQAVLENDAGMIYADKALSSILNIINKKYSDKITIKDYTKIIDIAMSSKNNNYIGIVIKYTYLLKNKRSFFLFFT